MFRIKRLFSTLAVFGIFCSCEDMLDKGPYCIALRNNSGSEIACYATTSPKREHIKNGETIYICSMRANFKRILLWFGKDGFLPIFICSQEVIEELGGEDAINNGQYLVKYKLAEKNTLVLYDNEVEGLLLCYPPDERMKDMEMDPPYESFVDNN